MSPFAPLIGQTQAVELLTHAVTRQRIAPAYLFAGPTGVGRSLTALCFIEYLFSQKLTDPQQIASLHNRIHQRNHPDVLWVEPTYLHQGKRLSLAEAIAAEVKRKTQPIIRLEQVREISQFLSRAAIEAPRSIVVIEQAELMPEAPGNALLKTLEEPGQATLILIAQSIEALLPTLVSRCQRIPFYRLPTEAMAQVLQRHQHHEILENAQILQLAQGSPGAAIAHWQQLQEIPSDLLQAVAQPPRSHKEALMLARQIDQLIEFEAQLWLIDFLQQSYWQPFNGRSPANGSTASVLQLLEKARDYLRQNVQPRLVWEVTLMKMVG